jgi:hypothetical protein
MKTPFRIVVIACFGIAVITTRTLAADGSKGDDFTQRDCGIALRLMNLGNCLELRDRAIQARTAPQETDLSLVEGNIQRLTSELDELVGSRKLAEQLAAEATALQKQGLGPKHPKIVWIERVNRHLNADKPRVRTSRAS